MYGYVVFMDQRVKTHIGKPDCLSLTLGYMMEGEKDLLQVVLWPGMPTIVHKSHKVNKH